MHACIKTIKYGMPDSMAHLKYCPSPFPTIDYVHLFWEEMAKMVAPNHDLHYISREKIRQLVMFCIIASVQLLQD